MDLRRLGPFIIIKQTNTWCCIEVQASELSKKNPSYIHVSLLELGMLPFINNSKKSSKTVSLDWVNKNSKWRKPLTWRLTIIKVYSLSIGKVTLLANFKCLWKVAWNPLMIVNQTRGQSSWNLFAKKNDAM